MPAQGRILEEHTVCVPFKVQGFKVQGGDVVVER
jgi:hypothetical protein